MITNAVSSRMFMFAAVPAATVMSFGYLLVEGRSQSMAANAIQELGGKVSFAWRLDSAIQSCVGHDTTDWRNWLVYVVDGVNLAYCPSQVCDEDLVHLKPLGQLRWLRVGNAQITDAGLEHLAGLNGLTWLDLHNTQITDAGLTHLYRLKNLRRLDLRDTQITDSGVAGLGQLSRLEFLDLQGTRVTSEAAAALRARLPEMRILIGPSGHLVATQALLHFHSTIN